MAMDSCDRLCTELVGAASLLASAASLTAYYYLGDPPGLAFSASALLGIYAASTMASRRFGISALLLALASLSAVLTPLSPLALVALLASLAAYALLSPRRPSPLPLSASAAAIQVFPPLALLPALSSAFRGRRHAAVLPAAYLASGALEYLGLHTPSSAIALAASAALAAYALGGFSRCPFRSEHELVNLGLALLAASAAVSFALPPRILGPLLAASTYMLVAGLLAPRGTTAGTLN